MGQRENEVEVAGVEQFLGTRGEPLIAGISLTLRTMPISAGAERDGAIAALGALVQMPAQRCCAAAGNRTEHFQMLPGEPPGIVFEESAALRANDIGHLQGWPLHFLIRLRDRFVWLGSEICSASTGLDAACR